MSRVIDLPPPKPKKLGSDQKKKWANVFYDEATKEYLWPRASGGWVRLNETSIRRHLIQAGISRYSGDSPLSQLDYAINLIQIDNSVIYAGSLAGHKAGLYHFSGNRILVTDSPRIIEPKPGDWPTLRKLIEGMLDEESVDQTPYLYGWLKVAYASLRTGRQRPGQALVLAGVAGCGKSLLQNIITEILGGRSAKPYQYMTGATTFNADLFTAEHQMVEDEAASSEARIRRKFGGEIKGITVNETNRLHAKGKNGLILQPLWRLSVTVNDEPEHLMVLPLLDASLKDKIMLLRANMQPFATSDVEGRSAFRRALSAELPTFLYWLEKWQIPEALVSPRFGVTHYHHPELVKAIDQLSPEAKLWSLIESTVLKDDSSWTGTAQELENQLTGDRSPVMHEARRLLSWGNACGVYLGRLESAMPGAVTKDRSPTRRDWTLRRPEMAEAV